MAPWFGWLLDVRLHLTLFAVLLFAIILSDGAKPWPERPWRVERLVQRQKEYERSLAMAAPGDSHKGIAQVGVGSGRGAVRAPGSRQPDLIEGRAVTRRERSTSYPRQVAPAPREAD